MKIFRTMKTALLTSLAGVALWSCSGTKWKVDYVPVQLSGESDWSILDTKSGEILCENEFGHMPGMVKDGVFVVKNKKGTYECFSIKDTEKPVSKGRFSQLGIFNGKVTFAVKEGKTISIIDKDYETVKSLSAKISQTMNYTEGLAGFCKDGKWGFLDEKGEEAIPAKYDGVAPFNEGLAFASKDSKLYIIDTKGEVVKQFSTEKYSCYIPMFSNGYCALSKGGKVIFIDTKGEEAYTSSKWAEADCYAAFDGKTVYQDSNDKQGLMTLDGEILIRAKYRSLFRVSKDRYIAMNEDGEFGVVNSDGETILPFDYDGLMQLSTKAAHYFAKEKGSGKWILIDEQGSEISKESFDDINTSTYTTESFYSEKESGSLFGGFAPERDDYVYDADSAAVAEEIYGEDYD